MMNDTMQPIRNLTHAHKFLKEKGLLTMENHKSFRVKEVVRTLLQLSYFTQSDMKSIINSIRSAALVLLSTNVNSTGNPNSRSPTNHQDPNIQKVNTNTPSDEIVKRLKQAALAAKEGAENVTKILTNAKAISDKLDSQNKHLDKMLTKLTENIEAMLGR